MLDIEFSRLLLRYFHPKTPAYPFPRVVVFGAGGRGREALAALAAHGVTVAAVADNDPRKHGTLLDGVPVVPADALPDMGLPVLVASTYEKEITAQLGRLGLTGPFYFRTDALDDLVATLKAHLPAIEAIYDRLADDASRGMYLQNVRLLTALHEGAVRISPYAQYDHPLVPARPGDVILDVGGMFGETASFFAEKLGRDCAIYTFEPSPRHQDHIRNSIRPYAGVIEHVPYGAWSCPTTLRFNSDFPEDDPGSHRVADDGPEEIEVIALDDFVAARGLSRVDLIKMDIEGAELEALTGARETIARFLPKLHISLYHKPSDCWDIFDCINGIDDRYTYYVGHHSAMHTETVLYALPDRRPA